MRWQHSEFEIEARKRWMAILAKAEPEALERSLRAHLPELPAYTLLRRPETGLVMVRGRAGGDGNPFNLGEMTVTRCSIRLADGSVGHAYVAGRDARHAERAAILDALLQDAAYRDGLEERVIAPLERAQTIARSTASAKAAATKVDFFTLVRGDE